MTQSIVESYEDRQWLCDVHLPHLTPDSFVLAMLTGNDDCPYRIDVYTDENGPIADTYVLQDDQTYSKLAPTP